MRPPASQLKLGQNEVMKAEQQVYNKMAEKELMWCNLQRAVHKRTLKTSLKSSSVRQNSSTATKSCRHQWLWLTAAEGASTSCWAVGCISFFTALQRDLWKFDHTWTLSLKPTTGNIKTQSSLHCSTVHFVLPPQISKIFIFHWFFKCNSFFFFFAFFNIFLYMLLVWEAVTMHISTPETHWQKLRHQQLQNEGKIKRLKAEEQDDEAEIDYL